MGSTVQCTKVSSRSKTRVSSLPCRVVRFSGRAGACKKRKSQHDRRAFETTFLQGGPRTERCTAESTMYLVSVLKKKNTGASRKKQTGQHRKTTSNFACQPQRWPRVEGTMLGPVCSCEERAVCTRATKPLVSMVSVRGNNKPAYLWRVVLDSVVRR